MQFPKGTQIFFRGERFNLSLIGKYVEIFINFSASIFILGIGEESLRVDFEISKWKFLVR